MSEDWLSKIPHHVQALLIADLLSLFSLIHSHPLYFAYLLFLLPYLVQFLSFLSPLLISTSLLLLTIFPHLEKPTRYGFLVNACQKTADALQTRLDDNGEFDLFEPLASMVSELEAFMGLEAVSYKGVEEPIAVEGGRGESLRVDGIEEFASHGSSISMVFQSPTPKFEKWLLGIPQEIDELEGCKSSSVASQEVTSNVGENCSGRSPRNGGSGVYECHELNSSLENSWCEWETRSRECKGLNYNVREESVEAPRQIDGLEASEHNELKLETRSVGSNGMTYNVGENALEIPQQNNGIRAYDHQELKTLHLGCETRSITSQGLTCRVGENLVQVIDRNGKENCDIMGLNLGGFGAMRKEKEWKRTLEKEWKRTLACKLYEERQSANGTEGMDLLWADCEVDSGKAKAKKEEEKKVKKEDIDNYEEEEDLDSQLCCLQALRFSTGKMNLGMRRLNSMRISKAFKGMGLFVRGERKIF